jgi:hypothetical protein
MTMRRMGKGSRALKIPPTTPLYSFLKRVLEEISESRAFFTPFPNIPQRERKF